MGSGRRDCWREAGVWRWRRNCLPGMLLPPETGDLEEDQECKQIIK